MDQTHALIGGTAKSDGKAALFHLGCEIEGTLHAVRRDCVLIVLDSDVAKAKCLHLMLAQFRGSLDCCFPSAISIDVQHEISS